MIDCSDEALLRGRNFLIKPVNEAPSNGGAMDLAVSMNRQI